MEIKGEMEIIEEEMLHVHEAGFEIIIRGSLMLEANTFKEMSKMLDIVFVQYTTSQDIMIKIGM